MKMPEPTYIGTDALVRCPSNVAVCPRCGGEILITIQDWEAVSRKVIGITVECESENWNDRETWHPRWGSHWYQVTNKVLDWMGNNIRIDPEP